MLDINDSLGNMPIDEAGLKVTEAAVQGVSSFMKSVCKPGLEELGYLLKDRVRQWRLNNILKILEKAKGRMSFDGQELNLVANPRVALSIIEGGSEVDSDDLQELWAGLFVSSSTPDGRDDCCRMAISGWTVVITPSPFGLEPLLQDACNRYIANSVLGR